MSGRGRFWGAEDSDDSSSTGSTSSSEAGKAGAGAGRAAPAAAGRFAAYESDSESDDGGNRVARSVKERTYEKLVTTIRGLTNQLKISNWVGAVDEFEKVQAVYDRNVNVLAREVRLVNRVATSSGAERAARFLGEGRWRRSLAAAKAARQRSVSSTEALFAVLARGLRCARLMPVPEAAGRCCAVMLAAQAPQAAKPRRTSI